MAAETTDAPGSEADPAAAYVDQLIEPQAADGELFPEYEEVQEPEGYRSFSTEYRHYQQDLDRAGKSYEDGLIFHGRHETRDYGEFEMLATARYMRPPGSLQESDNSGGRLTLRQYGFAVNEDWLLDNSLGILRSDTDPLLSSSYRINLPSTLVSGLRNWSRNDRSSVRFSAGKIGILGVGRIEDFEFTSGTMASMGLSHSLNPRWHAAAQLIAVNDSDTVADHESGAMVLQYQSQDKRHRYTGHALFDSEGSNGIWLDGDDRLGRWRHRYGIFRLDPDLLWSDATITDDQQGLYTRSELRSPRYNLTVGTDFNENNVENRADRPLSRTSNLFVTGNRRFLRSTSLGGTASVNRVDPRNTLAGEEKRALRLSTYVQQRFGFGTSRLEVFIAAIEEGSDEGDVHGVIWDQSWNLSRQLSLSTTLSHEKSDGLVSDEQRDSASILFSHSITPDLDWNGSANYTRVKTAGRADTDNYNATLGAGWQFLRNWAARLDLTWTQAEESVGVLADAFNVNEKTLLLSIRHSVRGGRPFMTAGNRTGSSGYGEISGEVFYDANRDGERQAGERPASGVFVYLDGRYERVTDKQGRFTFNTVPAGEHAVRLAIEDLPLPWGLEDESPLPVVVSVRQDSVVNFALTRINE
ncbi:MAG: hypothetical protein ABFS24_01750 [Pseudomonadota bacterium]